MTWRSALSSLLALKALPWVLAGVLLVAFLMTCGDSDEGGILSEETEAELERLRADSAAYATRVDSLEQLARASIDTSLLREESARATHRRADTHGRDADAARVAVIRAATLSDSLDLWRVAYEERSQEVNALRMAFDTLNSALILARRSAELERERASEAEERASALQALNARILDDVRQAEEGCKVLGFIPCPSRKAAFAVGVAVGAGAALGATLAVK